ncbi:hypothetical protein THAOC_11380, partial [Thalassiosira oceanica]
MPDLPLTTSSASGRIILKIGDDNGPGSEPPPRNRIGIATAFVPSRRRSPAAVGKPSFPRFKVYYLPRRRVRFEPRPLDLRHRLL